MRRLLGVAVVLLATVAAGHADEAVYIVRGAQLPVGRVSAGHVQEVAPLGDGAVRVRVATSMSPLRVDAAYAPTAIAGAAVPPGFVLPADLARGLADESRAWSAATRVLRWVAARVVEDSRDVGDQDAASILARGRGRCSGLANLTAALLLAAGFEARTVSGVLVGDQAVVPHRWVECSLPGVGWVATDPTLGFWVVTPRHVAFGESVITLPEVVVEQPAADLQGWLPRLDGRPLRPNQGADLVCRTPSPRADVVVVLSGGGGETFRARLDPEARFEGLLPGRWDLTVVADGRVVEQTVLDLVGGVMHSFAVGF